MVAPPAQSPNYVITYSDAIEERIARLQARCASLQQENDELHQFIDWEDQLFAHRNLIPSVKLTTRELRRHPPGSPDEAAPVKIWEVGKLTGISPKTTGQNITFLHNHQVIKREEERDPRTKELQVSVQLLEPFSTPATIDVPERPKSGYHPRKAQCLLCDNDLEIETAIVCKHCQKKLTVRSRPAMLPQDSAMVEQFDAICRLDAQLEPTGEAGPANNLSAGREKQEPAEETSESPLYTNDSEVSSAGHSTPTEVSSNTPPSTPAVDPDIIYKEWLQRQWGQGQLIYATGRVNASDKHKSITEVGYTPDFDAYLAGDLHHIYGSNPLFEDGSTYFLHFDFDEKQPEHDAHYKEYMTQLAAGGVASLYFPRRPGRGHFIVAFDARVEAQAAYDFVIALCPALATVNECFPIGDKVKQRISWPFFQRIGDIVHACKCIAMMPSGVLLRSDGIHVNRRGLARILDAALTPASLVEAFVLSRPAPAEAPPDVGGGYWIHLWSAALVGIPTIWPRLSLLR